MPIFILELLSQIFITWSILVLKPEKEYYFACGFILALIMDIYLIYDSQLLREKYRLSWSLNHFIFANLDVYLDAIKLVLNFIIEKTRIILDKMNNKNII